MTGVEEAALVSAVAPELLTAAGGTLGAEIGGMTAASALPFLGEVGPAAAGMVAGDAFLPGMFSSLAGEAAIPGFASSAAPELLGSIGMLTNQGLTGGPMMGMPGLTQGLMSGPVTPFAQGAVTAQPGMASAFGPVAQQAESAPWMNSKRALQLAQMAGSMGGGGEQRPMGAPADFGNPLQRPGLMSQEQITKKWLLENDPNTYRRLYGEPRGVA